jgi:hypothetical protein
MLCRSTKAVTGQQHTHILFRDTVQFACCLEALLWLCHVISKTVWHPTDIFSETICKGKVVPLQAWCGPEGSRRFRLPDFHDTKPIRALPNVGKAIVIKGIPGTRLRVSTVFTLMKLVFWDVTLHKRTGVPVHIMKAYKGSSRMTSQFLPSALDVGEWSVLRQGRFKAPTPVSTPLLIEQ